MKVIFLDVDGVLAHDKTFKKSRGHERLWRFYYQIDEDCMKLLVRVILYTGAKVVVSSTWRRVDDAYHALAKSLRVHGAPDRRSTIIGKTPSLDLRNDAGLCIPSRGAEIAQWLREHPEVERYVCIDDGYIMGHPLVHIAGGHYNGGFQEQHAREAISKLTGGVISA